MELPPIVIEFDGIGGKVLAYLHHEEWNCDDSTTLTLLKAATTLGVMEDDVSGSHIPWPDYELARYVIGHYPFLEGRIIGPPAAVRGSWNMGADNPYTGD